MFFETVLSYLLVKIYLSGLSRWASPRLAEQWKVWIWLKGLVSQSSLQQKEVFLSWACIFIFVPALGALFSSLSQVGDTAKWWRTSLLEGANSWMVLEEEFPTQTKREINIELLIHDLKKVSELGQELLCWSIASCAVPLLVFPLLPHPLFYLV